MMHAANISCWLWRYLLLQTLCRQQYGSAGEYSPQSCSSQRDDKQAKSVTDVWITSLPLRPSCMGGASGEDAPLPQRPHHDRRGGAMGGRTARYPSTSQMDIDQVSIARGHSVTTVAEPEGLQAQMTLLTFQSLANSSSLKSLEDDDTY